MSIARAATGSGLDARGPSGDLRLAAIDVGSNSLHMVVAQVDADGGLTILWRMKEMVGLGRNSFPSHRLSQEAMDRAVLSLARFGTMATRRGCEKVVAVATSAVREAENGGDFIERARRETGINVRVVSAKEEARLIYVGVRHALELGTSPNLIVDVGGGSVEFIVANAAQTLLLESRKLGAARMTARYVKSDPAKKSQANALLEHFEQEAGPVLEQVRSMGANRAIGTSGTLENLALMCRNGVAPAEGQALTIEREALEGLAEKLLKSEAADRVQIKGLDEKRQDQILAGALLLRFIMSELKLKRIEICGSALREGILLDYVGRHLPDLAVRRQVPDPRRRSVMDLARKCEWNEAHSAQVAKVALKLFDQLAPLHRLDRRARELLEFAAMLHDIGWHISSNSHHKHSMYLVRHGNLKGFTPAEVEVIANITRYHRRSLPKPTHESYQAMGRRERRIVDVGGAILRIADGLDRTHGRVVKDLTCDIRRRRVRVDILGRGDLQLELWAARRKTDMFLDVFGRAITFRVKPIAETKSRKN